MEKTLRFTHAAPGILRMRLSESHGQTLAERYGILTPPTEPCSDSGIAYDSEKFTLPNGRTIPFRIIPENSDEYRALYDSLADEFKDKYTNFTAIIGSPEENQRQQAMKLELLPPESSFAITFGLNETERFYGLGEGANDRIQLRGGAYQNWTRYQYNEIPIPLAISSEGWGVFLNARARSFMDIGKRDPNELLCLGEDDELDLFVLAGDSLTDVLKLYHTLTGKPMLMPKWAYGLTYIAPMYANQFEVLDQAERLRREHIPVDMVSLEPGWMDKIYDYSTKKKFCESRFHMPDFMMGYERPNSFIAALHRMGFKLSLWTCIRWDLTGEAERELVNGSPDDFGEAWYEHLKQFVDVGADGFKLDPADIVCCFDRMNRPRCFNGLTTMQMHNLNQVLLPKQMYTGFKEQKGVRPMHHYSGGYSGIQRWSASTTGDNGGELGAMIWLETLALTGHMNTTIDMNIFTPESVHFGMFVPWAHLNAWLGIRQPWLAGERQHRMFVEYARLRYRLLPYYYSAALEGHEDSIPMLRPMPMAFPDETETLDSTRQYMVGENLLISAYTDKVHLPAGRWTDAWTGAEYEGPCDIDPYTPPETRGGGLFIRGGAIIPNWRDRDYASQLDDSVITLDVYPDGFTSYVFREDDGISLDYETKTSCHTSITVEETDEKVIVNIGERVGEYDGKPETRTWLVRVHPKDPDGDQFLEVRCAPGDKVYFSIPKNPVALFNPDGSDALKV